MWRNRAFRGERAGVRAEGPELAEGRAGVARGREAAAPCRESPALAAGVGRAERGPLGGGGASGGAGRGVRFTGVLSRPQLAGDERDAPSALRGPPPSVVRFCRRGLPARAAGAGTSPPALFGQSVSMGVSGARGAAFWWRLLVRAGACAPRGRERGGPSACGVLSLASRRAWCSGQLRAGMWSLGSETPVAGGRWERLGGDAGRARFPAGGV